MFLRAVWVLSFGEFLQASPALSCQSCGGKMASSTRRSSGLTIDAFSVCSPGGGGGWWGGREAQRGTKVVSIHTNSWQIRLWWKGSGPLTTRPATWVVGTKPPPTQTVSGFHCSKRFFYCTNRNQINPDNEYVAGVVSPHRGIRPDHTRQVPSPPSGLRKLQCRFDEHSLKNKKLNYLSKGLG